MLPGTAFLGKHLLAFLTAVVVPLPGAIGELWAQGGASTLLKVLLVHWGGWCLTHASSGLIARAVGGSRAGRWTRSPPATPPQTPNPDEQELLRAIETKALRRQRIADAHQRAVRDAWTSAACAAYALLPFVGPAPALVCTLQASLLHGQRLPRSLGLGPAAPLVISASSTAAAAIGLGWLRAETVAKVFQTYSGQRGSIPFLGSAQAVHVELLSAATFALGFRVFALRGLVLRNIQAILTTVVVGASSSLMLTPVAARLSGLSPALCLMLSQRSVTAPFALAGAAALGPTISPVLTASVVSIGAIHCAISGLRILARLGLSSQRHPVARGLAMGCSSYGVGTGTLLQEDEEEAAGVSSAALVLMGLVHAILCSHGGTVRLLRRLAGAGGVV